MALKKIRFMDTSFRDGFQSVFGARVKTEDFLPALEASVEAGIDHFEFGGGARFQSLFFYCQESAFDMMDRFRLTVGPEVELQTLARGINVVGLSQQPKDIIEMHARLFKKHGATTIRNFDALNDMRNLAYSARCIKNAGLKHQLTITLMGLPPGITDPSVHTSDFYTEKLKQALELEIPFDSIVFKDASGTCPPEIVYETVKKTRDIVGKDTVLWFHTHDTAGAGTICYKAAIRGGVDGIDVAQAPVSSGTGQPDILSVWHALRNTDFTLDIDFKKIVKSERVFEECMSKYMIPPEAKRTTPSVVLSPMPGGALTANTMMMRDSNTLHLYPQVINEMAEVVQKGGFGTSVTPVSQFYFQQAYMNVIKGSWKHITDGFGNMVLGYFGKTPRDPDPEIVKLAEEQLGKPKFDGNPVDILNPGIPPAKKTLLDNNIPVSDENIFIIATCKDKGLLFLKGEAPLQIYYKKDDEKKDEKTQTMAPPPVERLSVTVNGEEYDVVIKPGREPVIGQIQKKDKPEEKQSLSSEEVTAPLSGLVVKVLLKEGAKVIEGETVLVLEAMKLETEVAATASGILSKIGVSKGDMVKEGQILFNIN